MMRASRRRTGRRWARKEEGEEEKGGGEDYLARRRRRDLAGVVCSLAREPTQQSARTNKALHHRH